MLKGKLETSFILSFTGSILILINCVLIILNGRPIVVSTYSATSIEDVMGTEQFWGRITFGRYGLVEGAWGFFWLFFALILLILSTMIFIKPKKQNLYGFPIVFLSLLSLTIGGGFAIGLLLSLIGGWTALEWPKPFGETLFGKILRTLKIDAKLYKHVANNPETLRTAVTILIIVSLVAGLGSCVYVYNLNKIKSSLEVEGLEILIRGKTLFTLYSLMLSLSYIGLMFINWLLLSLAIYLVTNKLTGVSSDFSTVARVVAFAQIPFAIHIFLPFMFPNEPYLSFNWPALIWLISAFWVFVGLVVGIKEALDISFLKAFGTIVFAGTLHWIILDKFIFSTLKAPGIILKTTPESSVVSLIIFGLVAIIATFLGVFSRK
jgi:hypothetical protein